ncbi:MAG TPA: AbrB/MazE/SpoVT family DNA-binding domain-containing protein [Lacisediminihabitans sp.]|uniref:AbrB/MazE/SpoVT family DNA-binding domain-containing protein n=1 Tax=Lacisediminihabitans sp. TaxID=2787631 RepID=UPI002ED8D2FD
MAEIAVSRSETSTLSAEGRVVVPARIRKILGLVPGTTLTFRLDGDDVVMTTREVAVARLQRMFREAPRSPSGSLVDELISERRAEAEREDTE